MGCPAASGSPLTLNFETSGHRYWPPPEGGKGASIRLIRPSQKLCDEARIIERPRTEIGGKVDVIIRRVCFFR